LVGAYQPTVKKLLDAESNRIIPESPGLVTILPEPLIVAGDTGDIVNVPDPLFLKLMYHPLVIDEYTGRLRLPAPPVHTKVVARLASVIVGEVDTGTISPVVANLPAEVVVNPAPASVAASA
jgi:hypothetical protein